MHMAVAGSSGLIGSHLVPALEEEGHRVSRVVRPETSGVEGAIVWDPATGSIDAGAFEGVDAVVNLAGRSIGGRRWTDDEKRRITDSRVAATRLLATTLAGLSDPPEVLVNASAIGIYGDRSDEELTEAAEPGEGFFPEVCRAWEAATEPAAAAGIRVAQLRTGIVLSSDGGAVGRLLAPFGPSWLSPYRWGLGGWVGSGRQWWSWIALEDEVRAILHIVGGDLAGPINLTAPTPVTNKGFMKAVGKALRRPVLLPIPPFVFKVVLGSELAESTLFDSQRVLPEKLEQDGFAFRHTDVAATLQTLIGS
jgi:uncharacterized protein (TIGR01777 family)